MGLFSKIKNLFNKEIEEDKKCTSIEENTHEEISNVESYDRYKNVTFPASVNATSFVGDLIGNATGANYANRLAVARNLWGQAFDGNANVTGTINLGVGDLTWGG